MEHEHLSTETLEEWLALDRTETLNRSLLHQIAVCPECRQVGGWLLDLHRSGALPSRFGVVDVALARSRAEAPALWERLQAQPAHQDRLVLLRSDRTILSWGLAELAARKSKEIAPEDAAGAVETAEIGVSIAEALQDDEPAEARWAYQLRAFVWSYLGNARRVTGDLPAAEQAFGIADSWWAAGEETTGDVLGYEPVILDLKASLRIAQRRFDEALSLLDQVTEIYRFGDPDVRDLHLAGRALVKKAGSLIEKGETERVIATLREAEALVDPQREPRLLYCLRHNLVDNLTKAGRFGEAQSLLSGLWELVQAHGSRLDQMRVRWVEARAAIGLGDRLAGRRALAEVRRELLADGIAYDAALVTLELAVLDLEDGRTNAVKEMAAEMVAVFEAQEVHREAVAAFLMLQEAAAKETATVSLIQEIAAALERSTSIFKEHQPAA
jgi:tetratricopeptide (TPR) repeat protein